MSDRADIMQNLQLLVSEAQDGACERVRYYVLSVEPDLLDAVNAVQEHGLAGDTRCRISKTHQGHHRSWEALERWLAKKKQRT